MNNYGTIYRKPNLYELKCKSKIQLLSLGNLKWHNVKVNYFIEFVFQLVNIQCLNIWHLPIFSILISDISFVIFFELFFISLDVHVTSLLSVCHYLRFPVPVVLWVISLSPQTWLLKACQARKWLRPEVITVLSIHGGGGGVTGCHVISGCYSTLIILTCLFWMYFTRFVMLLK